MSANAIISTIIWSVSYYIPAERCWQFAGEGGREWARERAAYLNANGHSQTRIRFRGAGAPIAAQEA